ncbi:hypothetical protein H6P81_001483 [Aristolochia fimbriata]|uniref:Protein kinase domain-containing protein n=1 Tax=Aristolochia fimbriata TaxID=158543 RepID=A0AAV7F704_ARIFI|nr:hypothetical protein H6P81_001483 [Aristolochia fimbriata]
MATLLPGASSIFLLVFFVAIFSLPVMAKSLSTVSISHTMNYTVICALIPSNDSGHSYLNCASSPDWVSVPVLSLPGVPLLALAGGAGFVCAHTEPLSNKNASIRCWRFAGDGGGAAFRGRASKRVYSGPAMDELAAGDAYFCGVEAGSGGLECWQWRGFRPPPDLRNLTGIAVGGEFVCGLSSPDGNVRCLGPDSEVTAASPPGNRYVAVSAGARHACAISSQGRLQCWGPGSPSPAPFGEFRALASGGNRSCALRLNNGTTVCWSSGDDDFRLPEGLEAEQFVAIHGQGGLFCGVSAGNYSLICWGTQISGSNSNYYRVFDRVLPGACRTTASCPCASSLPDSGNLCPFGSVICLPCPPILRESYLPSAPQSPTPASGRRGLSRTNVAFLIVGTVGSTVALAVASYFLVLRFCLRKGCSRVHDSGRLEDPAAAEAPNPVPAAGSTRRRGAEEGVEEFPLRVLETATEGFSEEHMVGSGAFGSVYRGRLPDGREVAIKRAETAAEEKEEVEKEAAFESELAQLSRLNHRNLVRLLGFCRDAAERILVYEYMPNGTLHRHLHGPAETASSSAPLMAWTPRMSVAMDAARGVEYLHEYAVPGVVHRDIKSSNVLLDGEWRAKVADFGLSLVLTAGGSRVSDRAAGTMGYIDPEYYRRRVLTPKSDVYSFGVLLLELLTGRRAIHRVGADGEGTPRNVVDYALPYIYADEVHRVLDPRLPPPTPYEIEAVAYVGYLAADCVRPEGRRRPSMTDVVAGLERALAVCLAVPPPLSSFSLSDDSE